MSEGTDDESMSGYQTERPRNRRAADASSTLPAAPRHIDVSGQRQHTERLDRRAPIHTTIQPQAASCLPTAPGEATTAAELARAEAARHPRPAVPERERSFLYDLQGLRPCTWPAATAASNHHGLARRFDGVNNIFQAASPQEPSSGPGGSRLFWNF